MDLKTLGERIRQARERLGLSQEEFAQHVGKDQRAISDYETGKRRLAAVDLATFAAVLQVSPLYFFEGRETTDDLDQTILREFHRLPTIEAKRRLLEVIYLFREVFEMGQKKS